MTTEDGIRLTRAGDVVLGEDDDGPDVIVVPGRIPRAPGPEWSGGRPLEVITKEKRFVVSRFRVQDKPVDMDCALPREVLTRRKQLIRDRTKQERSR